MTPTIGDAWAQARRRLPGDSPALDAQVLLSHASGRPRDWLLAHGDAELAPEQWARFNRLVDRCAAGEPLPYVLGRWEFFGLEFIVTPDVLIPRPETELLVEKALAWMRAHPPSKGGARIVDVGTGSGCIAVSLAFFRPSAGVVAVDLSPAALEVARQNAGLHDVAHRIEFVQGSLLEAVSGAIDGLCATLPYIPTGMLRELPVSKTEPPSALDGGPDGLRWIRELLAQAPGKLASPGFIGIEIEASQGPAALALARTAFPEARVELHQDLAGLDRLVTVEVQSPIWWKASRAGSTNRWG